MQPGAFFREPYHFEVLARTVLPELARAGGRRIRLWSAGCSSGEEAWSLAMIVEEARLPPDLGAGIVASDSDPHALARASDAVYTDLRMARVTAERRQRHFVRGVGPRQGLWRVTAPLRDRVEFCALDLMGPWPARDPFDVVVCHDPIAALDPPGAARLVRRFAEILAPGGVMFLGANEAVPDGIAGLEVHGRAIYRKLAAVARTG